MRLIPILLLLAISGCTSIGLSPEDKSKVVEEALEDGKTQWCVDLAVIEPVCIYKHKEPYKAS